MSIWRRFDGHGFPSLLTTNVEGRRPVFRNPVAAHLLVKVIRQIEVEEGFQLIAYVVMPDHLHVIAWFPLGLSAGRVMKMIKGRFAREYQLARGATGTFWQSRYHEKALRSEEEVWTAVEYPHHNPIAARIVAEQAKYLWSSAGLPLRALSG